MIRPRGDDAAWEAYVRARLEVGRALDALREAERRSLEAHRRYCRTVPGNRELTGGVVWWATEAPEAVVSSRHVRRLVDGGVVRCECERGVDHDEVEVWRG